MPLPARPLAVKDTTAAAMLDMTASNFRRLVDQGALPPAKSIGGYKRWNVAELAAILSGEGRKRTCSDDDFE